MLKQAFEDGIKGVIIPGTVDPAPAVNDGTKNVITNDSTRTGSVPATKQILTRDI